MKQINGLGSFFFLLKHDLWVFALVGIGILSAGCQEHSPVRDIPADPAMSADQRLQVETFKIQPQTDLQKIELSGTIQPIEQAVLSTRVMGRITRLSLEAGDPVRKGELVAQVNVADIAAQGAQAQSGVAQAQAELARSQATVSQLEAQRIEAEFALNLADINQKRIAALQAEGAVSLSQLDEANTALEQAKARVSQAEAGIRQAQAAVTQSLAAVGQAQAGVTVVSVNEGYGSILAPFNGVVTEKMAYEGEIATPGMPILKLENPDRLQLTISVPEANLRYVKVGQSVKVYVDAADQTLTGSIEQIVPSADPNSRSFLVKIPLQNPGNLISGMFGRIELPTNETQQIIMVPSTALIERGQLRGVYIVESTADGSQLSAILRWVKIGKTQGDYVEIVSGLTPGDQIIISDLPRLSDGLLITVRK